MIDLRKKHRDLSTPRSHPDFDFVKPGSENVFMVGLGCKSGIVFTEPDDYEHFSRDPGLHRFIKCYEADTIDRFKGMQENLIEMINFRSTAKLLSCTQKDVIQTYIEHYPEREIYKDLTTYSESV